MRRVIAALALLAAPALAQPDARPALTVAVQDVPRSLDPLTQFGNVDWRGYANIFDGLLTMDFAGDFRPLPALAESWRRIDEHTLELKLRDGVHFHDGSLFTAEDVVVSFGPERMRDEAAPGYGVGRIFLGTVADVTAIDPRTVRIRTSVPDPLLEQRLGTIPAAIISAAALRAAPDFHAWNTTSIVSGTGPYRVRSWRTNSELMMDAFDGWWGGKATARSIRLWVVPEVAARVAALRSGAAQIATDLPPDQFPVVTADPNLEVTGGEIANHRVIVFDTTNPVLRDPRVRRALSLAIDRKAIVDSLWDGKVTITRSHQFPAFRDMYIADWPQPAYDPEAARRLLREAGYNGARIEYRILPNYYTNEVSTAQVLVEMWRAVGLNVELAVKENFSQVTAKDGTRGIRNWSNTMTLPDPVGGLWRLYGSRGPVQNTYGEWTNAEFNRLGAILESSLDPAARKEAWRGMLQIYDTEDPVGTVLHSFGLFYGKRRDVNWTPLPVEWMDFRPAFLKVATR